MVHIRQSKPYSGLGFQVIVLKIFSIVPSSLESGGGCTLLARLNILLSLPPHEGPLSSELGTYKRVKTRFWP
jgi:hypothetical protein